MKQQITFLLVCLIWMVTRCKDNDQKSTSDIDEQTAEADNYSLYLDIPANFCRGIGGHNFSDLGISCLANLCQTKAPILQVSGAIAC